MWHVCHTNLESGNFFWEGVDGFFLHLGVSESLELLILVFSDPRDAFGGSIRHTERDNFDVFFQNFPDFQKIKNNSNQKKSRVEKYFPKTFFHFF